MSASSGLNHGLLVGLQPDDSARPRPDGPIAAEAAGGRLGNLDRAACAAAKHGGLPLMEALARRQSSREFARDALPMQVLLSQTVGYPKAAP